MHPEASTSDSSDSSVHNSIDKLPVVETPYSIVLGALFITGGFLANTVQGALGKIAQETMAPGQFLWILLLIALAVLLPTTYWSNKQENDVKNLINTLERDNLFFLLGRAVFGLCGFYLFIWAAGLGSLVDATVLLNTTPVFIPVIGVLVLNKQISGKLWLAIALGCIGLILVVQPDASLLQNPANLIGLGAGLSAAVEFLIVRHLSQTLSPSQQTISYLLLASVLIAPIALYQWQPLTIRQLEIIAAAAGSFLVFQLLLVKAYSLAEPHQIGVFQYSSVIFAALIDWLLFTEFPNRTTLLGIVLISVGGVLSIYLERTPEQIS